MAGELSGYRARRRKVLFSGFECMCVLPFYFASETWSMVTYRQNLIKCTVCSIVLRPNPVVDPVQGTGFEFWPGYRVLTESPGQFNFFKKNQNDFILIKKNNKKKSTGLRPGLDWSPGQPAELAGSHRVFYSFIFSSTRPGFGPRSVGSSDGPGFKTMVCLQTNPTTHHDLHSQSSALLQIHVHYICASKY